MMDGTLVLGAVAYDAKVVPIWDGFQRWFRSQGLDFDYVLYSNYERQVEQHFAGAFHVAWNSPLAWVEACRVAKKRGRAARAVAMRDTDQDLTSLIVVRADSPVRTLADLGGKTVGCGAGDSPQATLIPLEHLAREGLLAGRHFQVRRFDVLVGKHGDHVGGERDAARALLAGDVDAACMIDGNHLTFTNEGLFARGATRVLAQTGKYDHCNFTVLDGAPERLVARFQELLFSMRYDDPSVRPLMDMEGLKRWCEGRTSGYDLLESACDRTSWLDGFLRRMGAA
ncbi:MAG: PhnD/SsuA/transferrin family substrate-binding protein [Planctomycetes bacterium]|nr:PhnD/SsuA/transferrin family substrate-binding protein [Planctomycetota bacterium]